VEGGGREGGRERERGGSLHKGEKGSTYYIHWISGVKNSHVN